MEESSAVSTKTSRLIDGADMSAGDAASSSCSPRRTSSFRSTPRWQFSLQKPTGDFSLQPLSQIASAPGFLSALWLSTQLADRHHDPRDALDGADDDLRAPANAPIPTGDGSDHHPADRHPAHRRTSWASDGVRPQLVESRRSTSWRWSTSSWRCPTCIGRSTRTWARST